jgi:hypothetical protein
LTVSQNSTSTHVFQSQIPQGTRELEAMWASDQLSPEITLTASAYKPLARLPISQQGSLKYIFKNKKNKTQFCEHLRLFLSKLFVSIVEENLRGTFLNSEFQIR